MKHEGYTIKPVKGVGYQIWCGDTWIMDAPTENDARREIDIRRKRRERRGVSAVG